MVHRSRIWKTIVLTITGVMEELNDVVRSVVLGDVDLDAIYLNSSTEKSRKIHMHRYKEMCIVSCTGN